MEITLSIYPQLKLLIQIHYYTYIFNQSMQQEDQCPNCHKHIREDLFNIHVLKCTSLSLHRSSLFNQQPHLDIPFTQSKIVRDNKPQSKDKYLKPGMMKEETQNCLFCMQRFSIHNIEQHMAHCEYRNIMQQQLISDKKVDHRREASPGQEFENQKKKTMRIQHQNYYEGSQNNQHKSTSGLIGSISKLGSKMFEKGLSYKGKAKKYCERIIEQRKESMIENIEKVQARLGDLLQNAIIIYIEQAQAGTNGMVSEEINRLEKIKYLKTEFMNDQEPDICTVCYCELETGDDLIKLNCKHLFHVDCISKWLKINSVCPVCKTNQKNYLKQKK